MSPSRSREFFVCAWIKVVDGYEVARDSAPSTAPKPSFMLFVLCHAAHKPVVIQNQPALGPQHTLCFSHEWSPAATDTFSGIRPAGVPGFIVAQLFGAAAATAVFSWLVPSLPAVAPDVLYRTPSRTRNILPNEKLQCSVRKDECPPRIEFEYRSLKNCRKKE
jgi:hypothetical protein